MITLLKKPSVRFAAVLSVAFLLRTIALGAYPIGLYSDEAAFGYNAYLLLKTGHDEYGRFWPVSFESFGDWKPPMQGWLAIPFIALLGLNEVAVRLPSAILGTATVAVIYFLAEELSTNNQRRKFSEHSENSDSRNIRLSDSQKVRFSDSQSFPIMASLLLAINPWHIFMSRIAMLVVVEVFFVSAGVLFLLKGLKNSKFWLMSSLNFVGAIYSYYGSRITIPLILLSFSVIFFRKIWTEWKMLILSGVLGVILLSPLILSALKNPLFLTGRARTTSVFFNDNVRLQLWDAHTKAGLKMIPPAVSRLFDNKLYFYIRDISGRYLSHFSPQFLFLEGDSRPPFKIPNLGYLHMVDLPFFLLGLYLIRKEKRSFILLYLFVSPFVASLTFLTPAANRSFNMVIPWTLISSYGLVKIFVRLKNAHQFLTPIVISTYLISFVLFAFSYLVLIPKEIPDQWHYGRKELMAKLQPLLAKYQNMYLTNNGGPPYIFLAFYLKVPPQEFLRTMKRNPVIDNLGWGHVDSLLRITIPREFDWSQVPKLTDALYVGFETEIPAEDVDILSQVYYPNGKVAYRIAVLKQ